MPFMSRKIFVTGIGTDVGKTIVSAVLTQALEADYWKPIQAGSLDDSDSMKVENLVSNPKTKVHKEAFLLQEPASPHWSAKLEGISISMDKLSIPKTENNLVIEGAGGIMVPINETQTISDVIKYFKTPVVLVSSHYLGSINHTLISVKTLKNEGIELLGIVFSGKENKESERIIKSLSGVINTYNLPFIGDLSKEKIALCAQDFAKNGFIK